MASVANPPAHVWLRMHCDFETDLADFSWSADGKVFTPLGGTVQTTFKASTTFQGVRPALFSFNTSGQPGGYADFDNYTVEEPRARGIEREIPVGKTIILTSSADGSVLFDFTGLSSNTSSDLNRLSPLINARAAAADANAAKVKFQVVDLGLGRVALKSSFGLFVSVNGDEVGFKDRGNAQPGLAESFQWVNLMRGDTMLMSLANHRYLTTQPNTPGPVTATALGASAARKSGAEFKWKAVD